MMNLGGRCTVQKSQPSLNVGVIAPWTRTPKNVAFDCDVGKISASYLVIVYYATIEAAVYSLQYNTIQTNEIKQTVI